MRFRVLRAEGAERREWHNLVASLPSGLRDIHFLPEYALIYQSTYGQTPYLAVLEQDGASILQPFVARCVNELPFLRGGDAPRYTDVANAYGFGGPLAANSASEKGELLDQFEQHFVDYCQKQGFASEFTLLHPLLMNHRILENRTDIIINEEKRLVAIPLSGGAESIWSGLSRGQKSSVNRAKRAKVQVSVEPINPGSLEIFSRLYLQTMQRHGAAQKWYFPDNYFTNCVSNLGCDRVSLMFARVGDRVVAAHMVLHGFNAAYYHFGGSDEAYHEYHAGSLLIFESAIWAARQGYQHYFLGGGVTAAPDDKLYRFKAGFSRESRSLFSYGRILNTEVYEELVRLKRVYEIAQDGCASESNYFPLYRR